MIVWDETMSTGVSIIDEQHKMLFQKFNDFSAAMSGMTARETAGEVLDFIQFYTIWHFGQEEQYMTECHCPIAAKNKKAHAEFKKTFGQFYTQWQSGTMTAELAAKTYTELEHWLVNHIQKIDVQLHKCVNSTD